MNIFPSLSRAIAVAGPVAMLMLGACGQHEMAPATPPKPVKVELVGAAGTAGSDSFIGTARALQRADLGFETPGRVATIQVEVGARVRAGQVLASLDDQPARLRLTKAQADLAAALALRSERRNSLDQQQALERDKIISNAALQAVQASEVQAASQVEAAQAAVRAAQRELALSRIAAPYDGEIVGRNAQPHADVAPGQPVLQIESGRELEVVAMLPEQLAARLRPGQSAVASVGSDTVTLRLTHLSARADNGSLVQAIFRVDGHAGALRSGGVVSLELRRASPAAGTYSLPASALMPGAVAGEASVYLLDPATGTLRRRQVHTAAAPLLPGGRVAVTQGLQGGEQVVVVGTAFLAEGQPAVAYASQTLLQETRP